MGSINVSISIPFLNSITQKVKGGCVVKSNYDIASLSYIYSPRIDGVVLSLRDKEQVGRALAAHRLHRLRLAAGTLNRPCNRSAVERDTVGS